MKFVVPIPLSLYLLFLFIAFSIGIYLFAIVAAIGFIYFLFRAPKETIGLLLLLLTFKYWQIALPLLAIGAIANYFFGTKDAGKKADSASPPIALAEKTSQEEKDGGSNA